MHRRRRVWVLIAVLVLFAALATYLVLRAQGSFAPSLDVAVSVRNTGALPLGGLSVVQYDGTATSSFRSVAPGKTVEVRLVSDDPFGESGIVLVDDATGRNYSLPPGYFENALHGSIDVEADRAAPGADLAGRARCDVDYPGGHQGWTMLK